MSLHEHRPSDEIERYFEVATEALSPGGVLNLVAQEALREPVDLAPHVAGDIILPPKKAGERMDARWQLLEGASGVIKSSVANHGEAVLDIAVNAGLRRHESLDQTDIARVDLERVVPVVEDGANRTSVVRRELLIQALTEAAHVRGLSLDEVSPPITVWQLGSDRAIPRTRTVVDPATGESNEVENAEYKVAVEIGGSYLPQNVETSELRDSFTSFDVSLASAQQAGWRIVGEEASYEGATRLVRLERPGMPSLMLVQPERVDGTLKDGFRALHRLINLEDKQLLVGTNGQYRAKDMLQASQWAGEAGVDLFPTVAIGDEAGFTVQHAGRTLVTAERSPAVYANELIILHRLGGASRTTQA